VFSTTAQRLARAKFSKILSNGNFASAGKGFFFVESWAASSQATLSFDYKHVRDAAALAGHHPPTRSDFYRKIVVSPSRNGDQRNARIEDLRRIFEAFERGEDPAPADPKTAWLPPPTRQYPL
jgi:hypothetical protein